MAGIIQEFKEFAMRGNVVDLAVGFIMGGAFNKIVTTLVDKIIMPPLGWAMKGVDFNSLALALPIKGDGDKPVTVGYGAFINDIIHFVIVAFALFMLIKVMNALKKKQEVAPAVVETPPDVKLLGEIRDLLKQRA